MFNGPRQRARRAGRTARGTLLALTAAFLLPPGGTDAYRFSAYHRNQNVPTARDAQLWSSTHWGLGDSLSWVVADDPGWTAGWDGRYGTRIEAPFRSAEEVLPPVAEALAVWSRIGSADIRWQVTGLRQGVQVGLDGLNAITVRPDTQVSAYAIGWARSNHLTNDWPIEECDIGLHPDTAAGLGSSDYSILIHELGHCLGLDHAAVTPHSFWAGHLNDDHVGELGAWGAAPQMSYGRVPENGLTPDDIIGASLLRPARGWLRTRGAISGEVTVEGAPASFASVWAIRTADGSAEGGIGGFTDGEGRFRIEGLAPGVYLIRAGPRILTNAHLLPEDGRRHDTRDGFALDPVTVLPGLVTDGVAVDLRRGRAGPNQSAAGARTTVSHRFAPLPGGEAAWGRRRRAAVRNAQDAPCPGLTVRADPPAPAGRSRDGRDQLGTRVTVERSPEGAGVTLDLLDPYATFFWDDPPVSATRITAWRTEAVGSLVRHEFDIEWPRETPNALFDLPLRSQELRIGFHGGACSGSPVLTCAAAGCGFIP